MTRKAFKDEQTKIHLEHLSEIARVFGGYEPERWSRLRNQEDFEVIFDLDAKPMAAANSIYAEGRNVASSMRQMLSSHEDPETYPTLTSYVDALEGSWVFQTDHLENQLNQACETLRQVPKLPWALKEMIEMSKKQIEHLKAARPVVEDLKDTNTFRRENNMPLKEYGGPNTTIVNSPQFTNVIHPQTSNSESKVQSVLSDPEKASLMDLWRVVPIKVWIGLAVLLGAVFMLGYVAGEKSLLRSWRGNPEQNQEQQKNQPADPKTP